MATKTITITNSAYEKLSTLKESHESFSEVIEKITGRYSLLDLVGILSPKEAKDLRAAITELRTRLRKQINKTAERI